MEKLKRARGGGGGKIERDAPPRLKAKPTSSFLLLHVADSAAPRIQELTVSTVRESPYQRDNDHEN